MHPTYVSSHVCYNCAKLSGPMDTMGIWAEVGFVGFCSLYIRQTSAM